MKRLFKSVTGSVKLKVEPNVIARNGFEISTLRFQNPAFIYLVHKGGAL